ncbi:hypothetical protein chiPu_0010606 [Chiloscyllium punctatum]|uniref:Uncharacterized protein n=1 Tax=Chiloscyllium punctatum TaxID=137246 RepID=A0A401SP44_CHIPU|nr:hypothetical protein [Chiloscyllium punctatum]
MGITGVISHQNHNYLIYGLTILGNETTAALLEIRDMFSELCPFTQQNQYALDFILAKEDEICTIVKGGLFVGIAVVKCIIAMILASTDNIESTLKMLLLHFDEDEEAPLPAPGPSSEEEEEWQSLAAIEFD